MGSMTATFDTAKDLTLVKATGKLTSEDFHDWMVKYYEGEVTTFVLWDLTGVDLSGLSTDEVKEIVQHTRRISDIRQGGKTALVFDKTLEYGMGRMFETYSDIANMPFEFKAFRNLEDARKWLGI